MDHQEFAQRLARRELPSVLLFKGPEEHLKQTALGDLRAALLPPGLEEMNESRLTAPETDEIIAAAETMPFGAERRLLILRDFPAIVGRGEAEERLLNYLPQVPDTAMLVFYCVQPIKQKKIENAVKKLGGIVEFKPLAGAALTRFVTDAFRDLGRECDQRTAEHLIFTCGTDTNLLLSEIAKIAAFHPEEPKVNPADVTALATPSSESRVFALVDAILAGQESKAFLQLRNLLQNGEARTMILYMLTRQFRLMQHVKIMQYEKKSAQNIASALGVSPYIAQQYIRQAAAYSGKQVKEAVALCLQADLDIKSGQTRDEGTLEAVMLRLLQLKA